MFNCSIVKSVVKRNRIFQSSYFSNYVLNAWGKNHIPNRWNNIRTFPFVSRARNMAEWMRTGKWLRELYNILHVPYNRLRSTHAQPTSPVCTLQHGTFSRKPTEPLPWIKHSKIYSCTTSICLSFRNLCN